MQTFMYIILAIVAGAILLAIYEKRKARKLRHDVAPYDGQQSTRGAYTQAERIRTEGVFLPGSNDGAH